MVHRAGQMLVALRAVLARFGIVTDEIHAIRSGRVNTHWRVVAGGRTFALRRYTPLRRREAIRWEHDLLVYLATANWPVAAPLAALDGERIVEYEGRAYALFPFLEGRKAPYNSPYHLRRNGGLLARLHATMADWPAPGQREGFGRIWDLNAYARNAGFDSFAAMLDRFAQEEPELAAEIRVRCEQNLEELFEFGVLDLPAKPIHMDFHRDNIRFQHGHLTALLDFDSAHLDARIADVAYSIALDCREPPTFDSIDPRNASAFLAGYLEVTPLEPRERRLLLPLLRAHTFWLISFRLTQWAAGTNPDAVRSIRRWLTIRLPAIVERAGAIECAIGGAAGESGLAQDH